MATLWLMYVSLFFCRSYHITIIMTSSQLKELSKRTTFIRVTQQLNPVRAASIIFPYLVLWVGWSVSWIEWARALLLNPSTLSIRFGTIHSFSNPPRPRLFDYD